MMKGLFTFNWFFGIIKPAVSKVLPYKRTTYLRKKEGIQRKSFVADLSRSIFVTGYSKG